MLSFSITENPSDSSLYDATFGIAGLSEGPIPLIGGHSTGTFDHGPLEIGNGAILTTGEARGALPQGNVNFNTGRTDNTYCSHGFDESIVKANFYIPEEVGALTIKYTFATAKIL